MLRVLCCVLSSLLDKLLREAFTYLPSLVALIVRLPNDKLAVNEARG
jgi:hypothetical protein